MAELKTKPTKRSVKDFIDAIEDEQRRKDCRVVSRIIKQITKSNPKIWDPGMVSGFQRYNALLKRLGKHKTGESCLYIKTTGRH